RPLARPRSVAQHLPPLRPPLRQFGTPALLLPRSQLPCRPPPEHIGHDPGTSRPGAGTKPRGTASRVGVGSGFASPSTLHSGVTSARVLYRARRGEKAPANPRIWR